MVKLTNSSGVEYNTLYDPGVRTHINSKSKSKSKSRPFMQQSPDQNGRIVGGVDEAGRGAVIGPMVVAGVSFREKDMRVLEKIGVRDSKQLSRKERAAKYGRLVELARSICICVVQSAEIDDNVSFKRLNHLEALSMAQVIDNINADTIFVDCCDVNQEKFRANILSHVRRRLRIASGKMEVFSFHHADSLHLAVSAASIVAKIFREEEIGNIRKIHREIGSGYPSDKQTARFLKSWIDVAGVPPPFARCSWQPVKKLLWERQQRNLMICSLRPHSERMSHRSYRDPCQMAQGQ